MLGGLESFAYFCAEIALYWDYDSLKRSYWQSYKYRRKTLSNMT